MSNQRESKDKTSSKEVTSRNNDTTNKATANITINASDPELTQLFRQVNTHLTLMEGATQTYYQREPSSDPRLRIPKEKLRPIQKTTQEYLAKFLPQPISVSTQMIGEQCPICLDLFIPGQKCRTLICDKKHYFHQKCVDSWFEANLDDLSCPLCRNSQYKDKLV